MPATHARAPLRSEAGTPMRALVTGATGFIGGALACALRRRGAEVGLLARSLGAAPPGLSGPGFTAYPVDLRAADAVARAVTDFRPTVCFHLASVPDGQESHAHIAETITVNTLGTVNLLQAIVQSGRCLTVIGDSVKVFGNVAVPYRMEQGTEPEGSYAISKLAAWRMALLYANVHGLPTLAIRPTLVYGPGQGINLVSYVMDQISRGAPEIRLMGGRQTRDPLYIDDVVDAFIAAAAAGGAHLNSVVPVGGGHEIAVADIAREVVRLMGSSAEVVGVEAQMRPTETMRSYCDNQDAERILGWRPRWSLAEGLRATIAARFVEAVPFTPALAAAAPSEAAAH